MTYQNIIEENNLLDYCEEIDLIDRCSDDFQEFCLRFFPHLFEIDLIPMHMEIMRFLSSKDTEKRLVVIAPRGHGKTTIVISLMIWLLCYRYSDYIFFIGANQPKANDRIEKVIDEIENNELIKRNFPHLIPLMDKQGRFRKYEKKGRIFSSRQVIQARGYKGSIRGELILGKRPDYIFVDDPEDEDVIKSNTQRENLRRVFYQSVEYVGSAYSETNIIVTDTAKHFDSLAGNLEKREDWISLKYSALVDEKEPAWKQVFCFHIDDLEPWEIEHWDKKGSKRKEWQYVKVGDTYKRTRDIRQPFYGYIERPGKRPIIGLGEGGAEKAEVFEQEFLSIPLRLHEMPLRIDNWKFFLVSRKLLRNLDDIIFMLDLSLGKKGGDYQAGAVIGRKGRYYFLIQAFLERIPLVLRRENTGRLVRDEHRMSLSKLISAYCKKYEVTSIYVEDNTMQEIYLETLMEDVEELYKTDVMWLENCRRSGINPIMLIPDIYGHTSKGKKEDRITLHLGILVAKGFVFFREDWGDRYRTFGNCINEYPQAKNDDAPDCLDMGIRVLEERNNDE